MAQFAKMVCVAFGIDEIKPLASTFTDVSAFDWYFGYVEAASNGIVNGVSDTAFAPNELITHEQMVTMIYRAITLKSITLKSGAPAAFTDAGLISGYAIESVNSLSSAGVINGKEDGSFAPKETGSRAQAAAILYQYFLALAK